jgi:hypothetical protein
MTPLAKPKETAKILRLAYLCNQGIKTTVAPTIVDKPAKDTTAKAMGAFSMVKPLIGPTTSETRMCCVVGGILG